MKNSFFDYVRAAFNAKPLGMFVAPNHFALACFGLLGLVNPGFLVLGAGLELAYLYSLSTNSRFRNYVDGCAIQNQQKDWAATLKNLLAQLSPEEQSQYRRLEKRCQSILARQGSLGSAGMLTQGEGLSRLLWIYLRLLLARQSIIRMLHEGKVDGSDRENMENRMERLQKQIDRPDLSLELRKSLAGQVDILRQRLAKRDEAGQKLAYLEAELTRIQEQVELIREQVTLTTDPSTVSRRIDEVSASLGGTSEWMSQQQQFFGTVEELLVEPPPMIAAPELKQ